MKTPNIQGFHIMRFLCGCAAVAALVALPGCHMMGALSYALFPQKIDARYTLPKASTFIIVDDGSKLLGNPALTVRMANQIGFELQEHEAVGEMIPPERINTLVAELGDDFFRTSVAALGRRVGADLVIHVQVEQLAIDSDPGLLKPKSTVRVKVLDIVNNRRLFPMTDLEAVDVGDAARPRGFPVETEMAYRQEGNPTTGDLALLAQTLTDRMATNVAKLFYKHDAYQPGTDFDE